MASRLPAHLRRLSDVAVLLVFATLIGLVVSASPWFRPPPKFDENRPRHPLPTVHDAAGLQGYPKEFDRYFADRVGFRDVLLRWHNTVLAEAFGEEDVRRAWVGSDGWLFLNVADPDEFRDDRPTTAVRYDVWADELAARAEHLKGRGIEYVVMLAPEKSSVYPEHLPDRVRQNPPPEPLAAMTERLKARGVRVVNPLPALLDAKAKFDRPLYHQQDSHWTPTGARVGYLELAAELRKTHQDWQPLADDKYPLAETPGFDDLRRFVRGDLAPTPPVIGYGPPHPTVCDLDPPFAALLPPECQSSHSTMLPPAVWTCAAASGPPVLMLCDSFGGPMVPFVSAEFRRAAVVLSDSLEPAAVDAERPAVVIQVLVGRKFYTNTPAERRYR